MRKPPSTASTVRDEALEHADLVVLRVHVLGMTRSMPGEPEDRTGGEKIARRVTCREYWVRQRDSRRALFHRACGQVGWRDFVDINDGVVALLGRVLSHGLVLTVEHSTDRSRGNLRIEPIGDGARSRAQIQGKSDFCAMASAASRR